MNPSFFGDSYDIVKRFFCHELIALGYKIVTDPMFTNTWNGREEDFYRLIGARPKLDSPLSFGQTVLFLDPDTGVNEKGGKQHVSFDRLAREAKEYALVFSFDQSFSWQSNANMTMTKKLAMLAGRGCHAMYYDSHARFLFVSTHKRRLNELRTHLIGLGLPTERLREGGA